MAIMSRNQWRFYEEIVDLDQLHQGQWVLVQCSLKNGAGDPWMIAKGSEIRLLLALVCLNCYTMALLCHTLPSPYYCIWSLKGVWSLDITPQFQSNPWELHKYGTAPYSYLLHYLDLKDVHHQICKGKFWRFWWSAAREWVLNPCWMPVKVDTKRLKK